jgi:hypothetical protein
LNGFGVPAYVDPKSIDGKRSNCGNKLTSYILNEKSDVYSVGVLLWEISSGRQPFNNEIDGDLLLKILKGLREEIILNTPEDYVMIYTGK